MLTGRHWVRDVFCKKCNILCKSLLFAQQLIFFFLIVGNDKLGWMYEFALEETQRYKESHVILEKALIKER